MKMTFNKSTWKYALLIISCLISILCVALVSCGVLVLGGASSILGGYIVSLLGSYILTVSFMGCFASLRESYKLSMIYIAVTAVCIIAQFAYTIGFAVVKNDLLNRTAKRVENAWQLESKHPGAMLSIQTQYSCCGFDSPQDYLQDDDDVLPDYCCYAMNCKKTDNIYVKGCADASVDFIDSQSDLFIWTNVILIVLELLSVVAAFYLGKSVKNVAQKMDQIVINQE